MAASTSAASASLLTAYRVDDLIVDIGRQRITRADVELPVTELSFQLFLALALAAPNIVSFDQLIERVWPGLVVSQETVSQRVKLVRNALSDNPHEPHYIAGVRGRGYRMLASVVPVSANVATRSLESPSITVTHPAERARIVRPKYTRLLFSLIAGTTVLAGAWGVVHFIWQPLLPGSSSHANSAIVVEPPKSIAVLPLVDDSPGGKSEYLGDGLAQELSSRLARVPGVRVASQTSTRAFKAHSTDVRTIARTLGVRHVLEGSVRREGDHVRVTAQLIDATSGYQVWSQSYDRDRADLLGIENDLSRSIVQVLQVVLSRDAEQRLTQPSTAHAKAFDLYLAGLAKLQQPTNTGQLDEAEAMFQETIAIDPAFALGHAGLCESYSLRYERERDAALATKAESACDKALGLDGSLREVNNALAHLYLVGGRNAQAASIYRDAIRKYPGDADSYIGLAEAYEGQHRTPEAEGAYRNAIEAEPDYWQARTAFGNFLFQRGRAKAAAAQYRRVTDLIPASAVAFSNLGAALEMTGDLPGAASAFEKSIELGPTRSAYSNSGTVYYYLGRFGDAARMFRRATGIAGSDHRVWGNLADALYQMPTQRQQAMLEYRHAIALAENEIGVNPTDAISSIQLAYYYARVGDVARSSRFSTQALKLGPDDVYVHYYSALIAIQHRDSAAAIEALRHAVELGYPAQLVAAAPEFADLRNDERFQRVLADVKTSPSG